MYRKCSASALRGRIEDVDELTLPAEEDGAERQRWLTTGAPCCRQNSAGAPRLLGLGISAAACREMKVWIRRLGLALGRRPGFAGGVG